MKKSFLILMAFLPLTLFAKNEAIKIETKNTSMVLSVNQDNFGTKRVYLNYFGKRLENIDELFLGSNSNPEKAYPEFGLYCDFEPAIRATHSDGNMSLDLQFQNYKQEKVDNNISLTTVYLKDKHYPFYVNLIYKTYFNEDVVEVSSQIYHEENRPVMLYSFASAYLSCLANEYWITHLHGAWGDECNIVENQLKRGMYSLDSKNGVQATQSVNPSFMISLNGKSNEETGEVIGGTLACMGNFKINFEIDNSKKLKIAAGISPFASEYTLSKGEKFTTPALALTYSHNGKGQISRNFHNYGRKFKLRDGDKERLILLNSWEGVYFNTQEDKMVQMINDFADLGGELFVMDDGWFGNEIERNDDSSTLGDWDVNKKKLPHGIDYLIDACEKRNMKFGIWVEPEMTNYKTSKFYNEHPDWVISQNFRDTIKGRGKTQLVLDLCNPKVQDFVYNVIHNLLVKHPRIAYVKWDSNMSFVNWGSPYLPKNKQSLLNIEFNRGLQNVLERLLVSHPNVTIQDCSSGGGRLSYGYLPYFHEFWTSDNTDAQTRMNIQWGTSMFFPAIGMAAHVGASPSPMTRRIIPIKFRFDIAMTGRLGVELQPSHMTAEELSFSKKGVETYKSIRPVIQFGDLYRILSPYDNYNSTSLAYVTSDKKRAVFFAYHVNYYCSDNLPNFKIKGLDPNKKYQVKEINMMADKSCFGANNKVFSGDFLMNNGLKLDIAQQYGSVVLELNESN